MSPTQHRCKRLWKSYATGRFETQVEVKRFLERQPSFPKDLPNGEIRNQRIYEFLTRSLYAGYIEAPKWNVALRKGQHEALISFETYEKVQARLKSKAKAPARKDISADFPLRGFPAHWPFRQITGKADPHRLMRLPLCWPSHHKT